MESSASTGNTTRTMFSFHKPKIYRSLKGCCICRAKSSSSRFTDSKRYEMDFEKCFQLYEKRSGEICNACVLLVKRWKKLPSGSTRNWQHVRIFSIIYFLFIPSVNKQVKFWTNIYVARYVIVRCHWTNRLYKPLPCTSLRFISVRWINRLIVQ